MKAFMKENGSSHIIALVSVLVLGAIGFIGYRVLVMNKSPETHATVVNSEAIVTPKILNSKKDMQQAANSLDNEKIDQNLNPDQLNQDLDSIY